MFNGRANNAAPIKQHHHNGFHSLLFAEDNEKPKQSDDTRDNTIRKSETIHVCASILINWRRFSIVVSPLMNFA